MKKIISCLFFTLFSLLIKAQNEIPVSKPYPQNYFQPPLDLPPSLAGSFGEIRGNHFHSGLDYRTNQREGYPVHAAADGYVSRIRVQIGGGGNIVYINHPNGFTTVYMHLQRFNDRILQILRTNQYRQQQYDVDFPLFPMEVPVKKGEVIAWSGRTGAVAGPHLHFEIRNSKTEETINAQLFGIEIPDKVKPAITALYMYHLKGQPFSQNTPKKYFQLAGTNGTYHINQSPVINTNGETGFGISTFDRNGENKNGVYSIELKMDDKTIYLSALESFFFDNSRAVNSHIDYPALLTSGASIQKSFAEPGNPLTIYKTLQNRGLINLTDDSIHRMLYIVKDVKGNTSTLEFKVRNNRNLNIPIKETAGVKQFYYNRDNNFESENVKIFIPKGNLYSDINLAYSETAKPARAYSKVQHIHTRLIPVHTGFDILIKPDSSLRQDLYSKAFIIDTRGIVAGGSFDKGYIKATAKTFGDFYITIDTVAPVIKPLTITDGSVFTGNSRISLHIGDNLSGIKSFNGYIDGKWVLMEFDPKTSVVSHTFDERTANGKHTFQLIATDLKDNNRSYKAAFEKK